MKISASKATVWLILAIGYTILTFIVSSVSGWEFLSFLARSSRLPSFRYDLIAHLIEYALLAWLILRFLHVSGRISRRWRALFGTVIFCGIIGGLNELWQGYIPNRTVGFDDVIANIIGAAVMTWWYVRRHKAKQIG